MPTTSIVLKFFRNFVNAARVRQDTLCAPSRCYVRKFHGPLARRAGEKSIITRRKKNVKYIRLVSFIRPVLQFIVYNSVGLHSPCPHSASRLCDDRLETISSGRITSHVSRSVCRLTKINNRPGNADEVTPPFRVRHRAFQPSPSRSPPPPLIGRSLVGFTRFFFSTVVRKIAADTIESKSAAARSGL